MNKELAIKEIRKIGDYNEEQAICVLDFLAKINPSSSIFYHEVLSNSSIPLQSLGFSYAKFVNSSPRLTDNYYINVNKFTMDLILNFVGLIPCVGYATTLYSVYQMKDDFGKLNYDERMTYELLVKITDNGNKEIDIALFRSLYKKECDIDEEKRKAEIDKIIDSLVEKELVVLKTKTINIKKM